MLNLWISLVLAALSSVVGLPTEEVAAQVIEGRWSNGEERTRLLSLAGYDAEEVQDTVNEMLYPVENRGISYGNQENNAYVDASGNHLTARGGVFWYGEQKETYYNLPMQGVIQIAREHGIGGEYWVREDGVKMLGDYIMLATNNDTYPIGTLVMTSLGMGISLDTGTFAEANPLQVDVAVDW